MYPSIIIGVCVGGIILTGGSVYNSYSTGENSDKIEQTSTKVGHPLYLTPYIECGDIENGQQAAKVQPFFKDMESYSGFLTVNKEYNSNMFFWFFPAEKEHYKAPLVLWIEGGPGISSLRGLLDQHGPFFVNKEEKLEKRKYYWSQNLNMIYLDNPVGAGFSYTEHVDGYAKNESDVAENLYKALKQFFVLFPQYMSNDFYIAGSSYSCKFVITLGAAIDQKEGKQNIVNKINLKGLISGNGFCDPVTGIQYGDLLYETGLLDMHEKIILDNYTQEGISLINQGKYLESLALLSDQRGKAFFNFTGFNYTFNFLFDKVEADYPYGDVEKFIRSDSTRIKLHVGNLTFHTDHTVYNYLQSDILLSVKSIFEKLLEKYKIIVYNGQLDIVLPYSGLMKFLESLNWSGADTYKNAKREKWYVADQLAGYVTVADKLTSVLVRNAGHNAATDKPREVQDLILRFIKDTF